ncbi:hypothetical protein VMCG_10776 [Cytospora schulzeri]|uniref:Uncharacterized protein n=1 Tax=Cytospora schulzeri TaxID=448051 RepID=A0A423V9D9_9PEZI|nr:hypothetical protein VMCG_10776 [Valsa malicola]
MKKIIGGTHEWSWPEKMPHWALVMLSVATRTKASETISTPESLARRYDALVRLALESRIGANTGYEDERVSNFDV